MVSARPATLRRGRSTGDASAAVDLLAMAASEPSGVSVEPVVQPVVQPIESVEPPIERSPAAADAEDVEELAEQEGEAEEEVEKLLNVRTRAGRKEYRVRWRGHDEQQDTWEPEEELSRNCKQVLREFNASLTAARSSRAKSAATPRDDKGDGDDTSDSGESESESEAEIECILQCRGGKDGQREYLTRWADSHMDDSWEPADTFSGLRCRALLRLFHGDAPTSPPPERIRMRFPPEDNGLHEDADGNYDFEPEGTHEHPQGQLLPEDRDYMSSDGADLTHRRRSVLQLEIGVDWETLCDPALPSPSPSDELENDPDFSVAGGARREYASQQSDVGGMEGKVEDLSESWEEYDADETRRFLQQDAGVYLSSLDVDELAADVQDKRLAYAGARGLPHFQLMDATDNQLCAQPRRPDSKAEAHLRTADGSEEEADPRCVRASPCEHVSVCAWVACICAHECAAYDCPITIASLRAPHAHVPSQSSSCCRVIRGSSREGSPCRVIRWRSQEGETFDGDDEMRRYQASESSLCTRPWQLSGQEDGTAGDVATSHL